MPDNIEVTPFIRWDIRDIITKADIAENKLGDTYIEDPDAVTEQIMQKVIAFVNENYTPKQ
jgi:hypothetical protein